MATVANATSEAEYALATAANGPPNTKQAIATVANASPLAEQAIATVANGPPLAEQAIATVANGPPENFDYISAEGVTARFVEDAIATDAHIDKCRTAWESCPHVDCAPRCRPWALIGSGEDDGDVACGSFGRVAARTRT